MEINTITFERLEKDFGVGSIRAVEANHARGLIVLVCDDKVEQRTEGTTCVSGTTFTADGDE